MPTKSKSKGDKPFEANTNGIFSGAFDTLTKGERWSAKAELYVEKGSGKVRQAGAAQVEGEFVRKFKKICEQDLFAFLDGVLNYWFLQPELHRPVCEWLTTIPPRRKLLLMPRNHGKSTIVGRGIPLHALIQPKDSNIYYPGHPGTHLRLVLAGETEARAIDHLRVIKSALADNVLLRALWPHACWDNPRKQAPTWSDTVIICPRDVEFAEPTIRGIGVGGAITGSHPNMLIKDDLTTEKAANEPSTMAKAIEWHMDSRALFANPDKDLEFITGTRWAAFDLPGYVQDNDPTVEFNKDWRAVVNRDGKIIYPFKYGFEGALQQLQTEHGVKFPFLFMNEISGKDTTDFMISDLRDYVLSGGVIKFQENMQDEELRLAVGKSEPDVQLERGMDLYTALNVGNMEYLRNTRSL